MSAEQRDDSCISAARHDENSSINMDTKLPDTPNYDGSEPITVSSANAASATDEKNNSDKDSGVDDITPSTASQGDQSKTNLRRGKWTPEEEAYARAVICDFNSGYLDAPVGTTLRAYLSGKLECDPMRITKKFTKDDSIGKKVFRPAPQNNAKVAKEVKDAQAKVSALYQNWKQKIETQKEETNRKASVEASLTGEIILTSNKQLVDIPQNRTIRHNISPETMTLVHRTAEWLERADDILSDRTSMKPAEEAVAEMNEIKSLIDQGPTVLAAAADVAKMLKDAKTKGLPSRLHSCPDFRKISGATSTCSKKRKHPLIDDELVKNHDSNPINLLASLSSRAAPVPVSNNGVAKQRKRKGSEVNPDDAKAFVSFLESVAHE